MSNSKFYAFFILLCLTIVSCTKTNEVDSIPVYENGKIVDNIEKISVKKATDYEIQQLIKIGLLSEVENRTNNCQWNDGYGGSINCSGGSCAVVFYNSYPGIGCFQNGGLSHAGLFRYPIPTGG